MTYDNLIRMIIYSHY